MLLTPRRNHRWMSRDHLRRGGDWRRSGDLLCNLCGARFYSTTRMLCTRRFCRRLRCSLGRSFFDLCPCFPQFLPRRRRRGRGRWQRRGLPPPCLTPPCLVTQTLFHRVGCCGSMGRVHTAACSVLPQPFQKTGDNKNNDNRDLKGVEVGAHEQRLHGVLRIAHEREKDYLTSPSARHRRSWCASRCLRRRSCNARSP